MISTITFDHGELTCTSKPGEFTCRFFDMRCTDGPAWYRCAAFGVPLNTPEGGGLYLRCKECLAHDKDNTDTK